MSEISAFKDKLKGMDPKQLRQAGEIVQTRIDFNKKLKEAIADIAGSPDRKAVKEYNKTVKKINNTLREWEGLLREIRKLQ